MNSGAFDFDGSGDNISLPVGTQVDDFSSGGFSYSFWFNIDKNDLTDSDPQIVGNYGDSSYGCTDTHISVRAVETDDKISPLVRDRDGDDITRSITSSSGILDGNWNHAVVTIQSNDMLTLYVDGSNDSSTEVQGITDWAEQPNFYVAENGCPTKNADCKVDDIRFYNKELSSEEVLDIYNEVA